MDICAGGTINAGATSITFTNHHPQPCTITSCNMPGWPTTPPVINPPSGVVYLSTPAQLGTYNYTPDCCDELTAPQIKVQGGKPEHKK
jgi:hypothetical protein